MTTSESDPTDDDAGFDRLDEMAAGDVRDPYLDFARLRGQSPLVRQESTLQGSAPSYVVYRHDKRIFTPSVATCRSAAPRELCDPGYFHQPRP
jgi:hypothetical protein